MTETSTATSDGDETTALTTDDRLWLLASKKRRAVLEILDPAETPVGIRELARAVVDQLQTATSVDRFVTTLHHKHLPLLDRLDVVDYDPERSRITAYRPIAARED